MTLSVIIPSRDMPCYPLVEELHRQLTSSKVDDWEIIVADDGSDSIEAKYSFDKARQLPCVRWEVLSKSRNRGEMRNRLPGLARYEWLLEINSNVMPVSKDFISSYVVEMQKNVDVVCGGVTSMYIAGNLRAMDESDYAKRHSSEERNSNPFLSFRNTNVLARKDVYSKVRYDESIREYGYEDLAFGAALKRAGMTVHYIDNPVKYVLDESNATYVEKTETALHTLSRLSAEQQSLSVLHRWAETLRCCGLSGVVVLWHYLFSTIERKSLCGHHPRLWVFRIYKLGYYLSLT